MIRCWEPFLKRSSVQVVEGHFSVQRTHVDAAMLCGEVDTLGLVSTAFAPIPLPVK
jgi:hypothetical protein